MNCVFRWQEWGEKAPFPFFEARLSERLRPRAKKGRIRRGRKKGKRGVETDERRSTEVCWESAFSSHSLTEGERRRRGIKNGIHAPCQSLRNKASFASSLPSSFFSLSPIVDGKERIGQLHFSPEREEETKKSLGPSFRVPFASFFRDSGPENSPGKEERRETRMESGSWAEEKDAEWARKESFRQEREERKKDGSWREDQMLVFVPHQTRRQTWNKQILGLTAEWIFVLFSLAKEPQINVNFLGSETVHGQSFESLKCQPSNYWVREKKNTTYNTKRDRGRERIKKRRCFASHGSKQLQTSFPSRSTTQKASVEKKSELSDSTKAADRRERSCMCTYNTAGTIGVKLGPCHRK